MNCIDIMVEEHKNIKRMLAVIRKYCYKIVKGEKVEYEVFYEIIGFIRNYADRHHHGKEETMLFGRMMEELGDAAVKLVRHGMLVEHDLGRLHTQELEIAVKKVIEGDEEARLDVIANAVSYTHLLYRHIQKEDDVVYKFARSKLSKTALDMLQEECDRFETDTKNIALKQKYLDLIDDLEAKVQS